MGISILKLRSWNNIYLMSFHIPAKDQTQVHAETGSFTLHPNPSKHFIYSWHQNNKWVAHLIQDFAFIIQTCWHLYFTVIQLKALRSQQIFAHAMTASLLWHMQNLEVITSLWGCNTSKNNIFIELIIVSKTVPHLRYHAHKSSGPWYDFDRASCYVTSNNPSIIHQIIYDGFLMSPDT